MAREIADFAPETIIVTSPHATAYRDWFHISPGTHAHGDMLQFRAFGTDLEVGYDAEFSMALSQLAHERDFPAGTEGERDPGLDHGTYIPLWFIQKLYRDFAAVRIGLSGFDGLTHYHLGQLIAECAESLQRRCVFIASGDLSHKLLAEGPYGFAPEGPVFDEQVTAAMAEGDFMRFLTFDETFYDKAAGCGLPSFQIMAGALDGRAVESELLSYEGPYGVGYGVARFVAGDSDDSRCFGELYLAEQRAACEKAREGEDEYVQLARSCVESFVRSGKPCDIPEGLPDEMLTTRAGAFVSIHEHGRLRGCIGTISPVRSCIAEEIVHNAVSACSEDPRFDPITPDELNYLEISVDILGECEPIEGEYQLDPVRYGVVVTSGYKRGLLLPNLEGVDTVAEQIDIARRKAGIESWEDYSLERFEVVRHEAKTE